MDPSCPVCRRPLRSRTPLYDTTGQPAGVRYRHQGRHILGDTPCWMPEGGSRPHSGLPPSRNPAGPTERTGYGAPVGPPR